MEGNRNHKEACCEIIPTQRKILNNKILFFLLTYRKRKSCVYFLSYDPYWMIRSSKFPVFFCSWIQGVEHHLFMRFSPDAVVFLDSESGYSF